MKKIICALTLLLGFSISAQDKEDTLPQDLNKKYEVKLNVTNLLGFGFLDASFETLLNEESSFGIAALVNLDNNRSIVEYRKFSLTPYYRRYFSNKFARGFFIEGFGMLHSYEDDVHIFNGSTITRASNTNTEFAAGISIGGKFVSKRGFTTEIYLGMGRNFGNGNLEAVGRGGVSLGYRF